MLVATFLFRLFLILFFGSLILASIGKELDKKYFKKREQKFLESGEGLERPWINIILEKAAKLFGSIAGFFLVVSFIAFFGF